MMVNTAVFTCSICGEASANICAYCTKDACSNHRCERCKRCSDCCECEIPLSAEESAAVIQAAPTAEPEATTTAVVASSIPDFLTPAEASVFAEEPVFAEPVEAGSVAAESTKTDATEPPEATDLH
jgi:hypothetical protein